MENVKESKQLMRQLIKVGGVIAILVVCLIAYGQDRLGYSDWDNIIYLSAASAEHNSGLTSIERETYYYINLVRLNAPLFSETYLKDFYKINEKESQKYKTYKLVSKELRAIPRLLVIKPEICDQKKNTLSISLKKRSPKELVSQILCDPSKPARQIRKLLLSSGTEYAQIQIAESDDEIFLFVDKCTITEADLAKKNNRVVNKKYFIVAGSFGNRKIAQERADSLVSEGYKNTMLLYDNKFFQVIVDGYPTLLEAQAVSYQLSFQVWIKIIKKENKEF